MQDGKGSQIEFLSSFPEYNYQDFFETRHDSFTNFQRMSLADEVFKSRQNLQIIELLGMTSLGPEKTA